MKLIWILVVAAACESQPELPDAAISYSMHDQVTGCDPRWAASAPNYDVTVCEHACVVRPAAPRPSISPPDCADASRPCLKHAACAHATSPVGGPVDCAATFDAGGGVLGCCALREVVFNGALMVPTFYECPLVAL